VRAATQRAAMDSTSAAGVCSDAGIVTVTKFTIIAPVSPLVDVWGGYVLLSENAAGFMYSAVGTASFDPSSTGIGMRCVF